MLALVVLLALSELQAIPTPRDILPANEFQFGKVVQGTLVEHDFILKNDGDADLELSRASMTPPLMATRLPRIVVPGGRAVLRFKLDTTSLEGPFDGQIILFLNDPHAPELRLSFAGQVVHGIEASPMPAVYLATQRGQPQEGSVELINYESRPLQILDIESTDPHLKTDIDTLEAGRRYRLRVEVGGEAPVGRKSETLIVRTSSPRTPRLPITVHTYVHERVYTFPDAVDLGDLPLRDIQADPDFLQRAAQILMVYQAGGSHFEVGLRSDVPGLVLKPERGPAGDRWQISVALNPERIQPGPIRGTIIIRTNDPKQAEITVPITGSILDKPPS